MIDFKEFNEKISDEMLAAYIDGNATAEEAFLIESLSVDNDYLSEIIDITNEQFSMIDGMLDNDIMQDESQTRNLYLPEVDIEECCNMCLNNFSIWERSDEAADILPDGEMLNNINDSTHCVSVENNDNYLEDI